MPLYRMANPAHHEQRTPPAKPPKLTDTWYLLDYVATVEKGALVADVINREVAAQINEV